MDWLLISVLQIGLVFAALSVAAVYTSILLYYGTWIVSGVVLRTAKQYTIAVARKASSVQESLRTREYNSVKPTVVPAQKLSVR